MLCGPMWESPDDQTSRDRAPGEANPATPEAGPREPGWTTTRDIGKPRLVVHDAAPVTTAEIIVTGKLYGGALHRGQDVVVQPAGQHARVSRLRHQNAVVEAARPGEVIEVHLAWRDAVGDRALFRVARGDVITVPTLGAATNTVDVWLERLAPPLEPSSAVADQIADRTRVCIRAEATRRIATVFLHGGRALGAGAGALAQLRFETPVFLFAHDSLLVCDLADSVPLATGRVLDPEGDRKHWQHQAQRALLEARAAAPEAVDVWIESGLARDGIVERATLLDASGFAGGEIEAGLKQLAEADRAVLLGTFAANPAWWQDRLERARQMLDRAHRLHPERIGLPLDRLETGLSLPVGHEGVFEAVLEGFVRNGLCREGAVLRRESHRARLLPRLQPAGDWLRQVLAERPLEPPSRNELTPNDDAARALQYLIDTGEVVEIGPDQVLGRAAYDGAVSQIVEILRLQGEATLSELRQAVGGTRRIVIPLCEKLDQEGVLLRDGNVRRLGRGASSAS